MGWATPEDLFTLRTAGATVSAADMMEEVITHDAVTATAGLVGQP